MKLNKTEQRFAKHIADHSGLLIAIPRCLRLPLDVGVSYRPDFVVVADGVCSTPRLIAVNGGYRGPGWEHGIERFRRARSQWGKTFRFELWTWDRRVKAWTVET